MNTYELLHPAGTPRQVGCLTRTITWTARSSSPALSPDQCLKLCLCLLFSHFQCKLYIVSMGNGEPFVPLPPEKYFIGKASHIDILFTIQLHVPIVLDLFGQSQIVLLGRMCNPLPQFLELLSVFFSGWIGHGEETYFHWALFECIQCIMIQLCLWQGVCVPYSSWTLNSFKVKKRLVQGICLGIYLKFFFLVSTSEFSFSSDLS